MSSIRQDISKDKEKTFDQHRYSHGKTNIFISDVLLLANIFFIKFSTPMWTSALKYIAVF